MSKQHDKSVPHIRIVGGGVAGLVLATRLGNILGLSGKASISLIDKSPTHVWKPMLHTFAAGTWNIYQQQVQFLAHAHRHHFQYIPGEVIGLERGRKTICLAPIDAAGQRIADSRELAYDVLILAFGSRANDFATKGVQEHCHFIDSQEQAENFNRRIRTHVAKSYVRGGDVDIAIVGGGATGVELAAELSRMVELASAYGDVDMCARLNVTLLEGAERILGAFPQSVSASATQQLQDIGITVRTGVQVIEATSDGFRLKDGETIAASVRVWAAGVRSATAIPEDDLHRNRVQQIIVGPNMLAEGEQAIFALGDCASMTLPGNQRPLPATAQVANQQAAHLIRHLPRWIEHDTPIPPFVFHDFGSLVSLSDYNAFGTLGRLGFFKGGFIKGRFAQFSHALLYRRHQMSIHGVPRALLLWIVDMINALVQPPIRMG